MATPAAFRDALARPHTTKDPAVETPATCPSARIPQGTLGRDPPAVQLPGGFLGGSLAIAEHNERLMAIDYAIVCLKQEGYAFTAAARLQRVRDWLGSTTPVA